MKLLFVGLAGVPKQMRACDIRLSFIANMLIKTHDVTILNRYSSICLHKIKNNLLHKDINVIELISSKDTGTIVTYFLFFLSVMYEPFKIIQLNKKEKIDIIHVYSGHFVDFIFYYIISRLIGAKVIYQYVEYRTAFKPRGIYHKINGFLCDNYGMKMFDGVLPISNFLEEKAREVNKDVSILKIPPICDYNVFNLNNRIVKHIRPYLLFCASTEYLEVVDFVHESYMKSLLSNDFDLVLVLSGKLNNIENLRINSRRCKIVSQLPYEELIAYFKNAYALFIPLRPILSDIARFPNKVCEYLASRGVVITTDVGEMSHYFKDGDNAIVAKEYSLESMVDCLNKLYRNEYSYNKIRENAYETGKKFFNIDSYEDKFQIFLKELI